MIKKVVLKKDGDHLTVECPSPTCSQQYGSHKRNRKHLIARIAEHVEDYHYFKIKVVDE